MNWRNRRGRATIGIDVGDRWVKAVQLRADVEGWTADAVVALPRDAAPPRDDRPDAPAPLTPQEVARLRDAAARRGLSATDAVVAAPSRSVVTGVLELPPVASGAPLQQIARNELAAAHRREPATMEVAYWELPRPARPGEGTPVMAAGCPHDDAHAILDPLERGGFSVCALDTHGWAIARACAAAGGAGDIVAAIDVGWSAAVLVLLYRGVVFYERSLQSGGLKPLADTLMREHRFAPEVVEYLFRDVGFKPGNARRDDWKIVAKARGHLEAHFESLGQELRLSVSYAQHQYPAAQVDRIVLTGGGGGIPGLDEYLGPMVDAPVSRLSLGDAVRCGRGLAVEAADTAFTLAAGLAMYREEVACRAA